MLRQLPLVIHGNNSREWVVIVSAVLCSVKVCCAAHMLGIKLVCDL